MALVYGTTQTITISPASLGSSGTFVSGRASTVVSNTSNLYLDALLSGKIRVGTTPTINTLINIYLWGLVDDTPTYPDSITGSDAAFSPTTAGVMAGYMKLVASLQVDATTSDRDYHFSGISVAEAFGGSLPEKWGVYVAHNTGVNLNATGGNHLVKYQGVKTS